MHCVKKAHSDIVIQLFGQLYSYGLNASLSTWDSKAVFISHERIRLMTCAWMI